MSKTTHVQTNQDLQISFVSDKPPAGMLHMHSQELATGTGILSPWAESYSKAQ